MTNRNAAALHRRTDLASAEAMARDGREPRPVLRRTASMAETDLEAARAAAPDPAAAAAEPSPWPVPAPTPALAGEPAGGPFERPDVLDQAALAKEFAKDKDLTGSGSGLLNLALLNQVHRAAWLGERPPPQEGVEAMTWYAGRAALRGDRAAGRARGPAGGADGGGARGGDGLPPPRPRPRPRAGPAAGGAGPGDEAGAVVRGAARGAGPAPRQGAAGGAGRARHGAGGRTGDRGRGGPGGRG